MCGGAKYTDPIKGAIKVYYPNPNAKLPVLDGNEVKLIQWGKRAGQFEEYDVPQTGWARIESLIEKKWNRYNPKRVRIPIEEWMEKDKNRVSHWFKMEEGTYLLGVKIEKEGMGFVYVVTHQATGEMVAIHERLPMIVGVSSNEVS